MITIIDFDSAIMCASRNAFRYSSEVMRTAINMFDPEEIAIFARDTDFVSAKHVAFLFRVTRVLRNVIPESLNVAENVFVSNGHKQYGNLTQRQAGKFYNNPMPNAKMPAIKKRPYREAIMMVGNHGSGKTTLAETVFPDYAHVRVNNGLAKALVTGRDIVIDATNMTKKARATTLKKLNGLPCRCIVMNTSFPRIRQNIRQLIATTTRTRNDPQLRGCIDQYERPTMDEGFTAVIHCGGVAPPHDA